MPLRLKVLIDVAGHEWSRTADVVKRLQLPRKTVDRVLQALHLLGLLVVDEEPYGESVRWIYKLAEDVSTTALGALRNLARNVSTPEKKDSPPPPAVAESDHLDAWIGAQVTANPQPVGAIAAALNTDVWEVERALTRLAAGGMVQRHSSHQGSPAAWSLSSSSRAVS